MAHSLLIVGSCNRGLAYVKAASGAGISVYVIDETSGAAERSWADDSVDNPTFAAVSPNGEIIAAVSEVSHWPEGKLTTLRLDKTTGRLQRLNTVSSGGNSPAYAGFDRTGRFAAAANYGGGADGAGPDLAFSVYALGPDGYLSDTPVATAARSGHAGHPDPANPAARPFHRLVTG